jgi:RNA polymerase sigma factor (sigma-70 family)
MDDEARYRWIADNVLPFEQEVRRWLRRKARVLTTHDLDDLVQEAYAHLMRANLSAVRDGRSFFRSTVFNLWLDQRRRSRIVHIVNLGGTDAAPVDEAPGPEQRVSAHQQFEQLVHVVKQLPPRQRMAFESKQFAGLATREIARRMNVTEKTVEMHLRTALARITRVIFGGEEEDDDVRRLADEADERDDLIKRD